MCRCFDCITKLAFDNVAAIEVIIKRTRVLLIIWA